MGRGGAEERVLDPSPSDSALGASTGQAGVSQKEVMESSPTFSPLSGSVLSVTPSSGGSDVGVDSGVMMLRPRGWILDPCGLKFL